MKKKYNIAIYYVYQDPIIAWSYTQKREEIEGRFVPKEVFINAYFKSRENVKYIAGTVGDILDIVVVLKDYQNEISDIVDGIENIDLLNPNDYSYGELEEKLND